MGRVLVHLINEDKDMEMVAGIDRDGKKFQDPFPVYNDPSNCLEKADLIIDFSHFSALPTLLAYCLKSKTPLVTATTGFGGEDLNRLSEASKLIPIFQSANMSLGVNVVTDLAKKAAQSLGNPFDIEIIEKHHNQKVDSPSGTAYLIANGINEALNNEKEFVYGRYGKADKRETKDIGIHAIRGGTIVGEHTVIFAGPDEIVEIKHIALSKNIFAVGAIRAGKFLANQKNGLYNMNDMLK